MRNVLEIPVYTRSRAEGLSFKHYTRRESLAFALPTLHRCALKPSCVGDSFELAYMNAVSLSTLTHPEAIPRTRHKGQTSSEGVSTQHTTTEQCVKKTHSHALPLLENYRCGGRETADPSKQKQEAAHLL